MSDLSSKKKAIQDEVDDLQTDLDARINSIKEQITATLSVQEWVKKYPLQSVGVAALAGFLLAYKNASKIGDSSKTDSSIKDLIVSELKKQVLAKLVQKLTENIKLGD